MRLHKDLATIFHYLRRSRQAYMESYDLRGIHGRLLIEVSENPGISQDGLVQRLGFDKSNVARQAAFLEEQGYLRRQQGQDKRVLQLYITDRAAEILPGLRECTEQSEQRLLKALTAQEQEMLQQLLQKLRIQAEGDEDERAD